MLGKINKIGATVVTTVLIELRSATAYDSIHLIQKFVRADPTASDTPCRSLVNEPVVRLSILVIAIPASHSAVRTGTDLIAEVVAATNAGGAIKGCVELNVSRAVLGHHRA